MFKVGAYLRLSRDDGDKDVSDSIENQRRLVSDFIESNGDLTLVEVYADDGYSGLNFERPAFIKLMADVFNGSIDTIITKDMSRLGREHIETSNYIEKIFPLHNIRYIAILDNYDSLTGSNVEVAPFKSLLNDMYAKDISKKVRSALKSKMSRGEFIGAFAPYGYKKHPDNNDLLMIDEYASGVVKRVFDLYLTGTPMMEIASLLNKENVPCPANYKKTYVKRHKQFVWNYSAINRILHNRTYLGDMEQRKSEVISYKVAKKRNFTKENWIIVKGTHERIIDDSTFDMVEKIIQSRAQPQKSKGNEGRRAITNFAGILKCGDCGRALTKCISTIYKDKKRSYYKCSTYKTYGKKICSLHTIREDVLNEIVLKAIKAEAEKALSSSDIEGLKLLLEKEMKANENTLDSSQLLVKLDKIENYLKKIYEDFVDGLLSKGEYFRFKEKYIEEKKQIQSKLVEIKNLQIERNNSSLHHEKWLENFVNGININSLTREVVIELVSCIKVYEEKKIEIEFKFKTSV